MYCPPVRQSEKYYLHLLLLHHKGITNFEQLRSVNGNIFNTFKEACVELGLLKDDLEWKRCLEEAHKVNMPYQIRDLFGSILIFNHPTNPSALF
jgi:hypothetical protein